MDRESFSIAIRRNHQKKTGPNVFNCAGCHSMGDHFFWLPLNSCAGGNGKTLAVPWLSPPYITKTKGSVPMVFVTNIQDFTHLIDWENAGVKERMPTPIFPLKTIKHNRHDPPA